MNEIGRKDKNEINERNKPYFLFHAEEITRLETLEKKETRNKWEK